MKNTIKLLYLSSLFLCLSTFCYALEDEPSKKKDPKAEVSETQQSLRIKGTTINLTARAGTMELRDENNDAIALFGFTSYTRNGVTDPRKRPIIFAFNGGPGSSSFWLHMGILGPKRIAVADPDYTPGPPFSILDNEYSILDEADLVMIDPVGTGLSVPVGESSFEDFWGVDSDIKSISQFIRQFLIEYGRMNSPKFLLGESYGTFRSAGIMAHIQDMGIPMNGVIMVSAVFDLRQLVFPAGDDLPFIVHFPTYATTAWYHDKIDKGEESLEDFVQRVRDFTEKEYVPALYRGNRLSSEEKKSIAGRLSEFTGLSQTYWMNANLRVNNREFFAELLRSEGKTIGRLDSRFIGISQDLKSQFADYDPQSKALSPAYITGFLDYFYNDLKVDKKLHYQTSAGGRKGFKWDWSHEGNYGWGTQTAITTAPDMARAMTQNPNLKVLVMNGYYDLATVFYGVEYTLDHMGLAPEIRDNFRMEYYEAGHMMYTHEPSMKKFKKDLADFIKNNRAN